MNLSDMTKGKPNEINKSRSNSVRICGGNGSHAFSKISPHNCIYAVRLCLYDMILHI
jgi:hypothetical protein